jgi:hypothetical protein
MAYLIGHTTNRYVPRGILSAEYKSRALYSIMHTHGWKFKQNYIILLYYIILYYIILYYIILDDPITVKHNRLRKTNR